MRALTPLPAHETQAHTGLGDDVLGRGRIVANLRKENTDGQDIVSYITGAKTGEAELAA